MGNRDWTTVGRIRDAHGIRGEVFVALKAKQADWLEDLEVFRLTQEGAKQEEFEVERASAHKDGLITKLKGVLDRNAAEALRGAIVEIPSEYLTAEPGERLFLGELVDCVVIDNTLGEVGPVVGLGSNGPQDLLVVSYRGKKFEVPLVDAFLVHVDLEKKQILMDLPPGLIEEN